MHLDTNGLLNNGQFGIDKLEFSVPSRHFDDSKRLHARLKRYGYNGNLSGRDASINRIYRDWSDIHFSINVDRLRSAGEPISSAMQHFAAYFRQEFGTELDYAFAQLHYIEFFIDNQTDHEFLNYRMIRNFMHLPYKKFEHQYMSTSYKANKSGKFTFYDKYAEIVQNCNRRGNLSLLPIRLSRMEFRLSAQSKEIKRLRIKTVQDVISHLNSLERLLFGEIAEALRRMKSSLPSQTISCESTEQMTRALHYEHHMPIDQAYFFARSFMEHDDYIEDYLRVLLNMHLKPANRKNATDRVRKRIEQMQAMQKGLCALNQEDLRKEVLFKFVANKIRGFDLEYEPDFERMLAMTDGQHEYAP